MTNQIRKIFSQQFGIKVDLLSQQTGKKKYGKKKSKRVYSSRKNTKKY